MMVVVKIVVALQQQHLWPRLPIVLWASFRLPWGLSTHSKNCAVVATREFLPAALVPVPSTIEAGRRVVAAGHQSFAFVVVVVVVVVAAAAVVVVVIAAVAFVEPLRSVTKNQHQQQSHHRHVTVDRDEGVDGTAGKMVVVSLASISATILQLFLLGLLMTQ